MASKFVDVWSIKVQDFDKKTLLILSGGSCNYGPVDNTDEILYEYMYMYMYVASLHVLRRHSSPIKIAWRAKRISL